MQVKNDLQTVNEPAAVAVRPSYLPAVSRFLAWAGSAGVTAWTLESIGSYLRTLADARGAATVQTTFYALQAAALSLTTDERARAILSAALAAVRRELPKPSRERAGRALDLETVRAVLSAANTEKQKAIIRALAETGCRVAEVVGVKLRDCTPNGKTGIVAVKVTGKGNRERVAYLSIAAYRAARAAYAGKVYLFEAEHGGPLSTSYVRRVAGAAGFNAGAGRVHPHVFRHTWATVQHAAGVPLAAVAAHLGHADISTTARYYVHARVTPETAVLKVS